MFTPEKPIILIPNATWLSLTGAVFLSLFGVFLILAEQFGSGLVCGFSAFLLFHIAFGQVRLKVFQGRIPAYRFFIQQDLIFKTIKSVAAVSSTKSEFLICFETVKDEKETAFLINLKSFSRWKKLLSLIIEYIRFDNPRIEIDQNILRQIELQS
jgi:hypothetical protein